MYQKYQKSASFASFAFQNQNFAQILENFALTCVRVSVCFRKSGHGPLIYTSYMSYWSDTLIYTNESFKLMLVYEESEEENYRYDL